MISVKEEKRDSVIVKINGSKEDLSAEMFYLFVHLYKYYRFFYLIFDIHCKDQVHEGKDY